MCVDVHHLPRLPRLLDPFPHADADAADPLEDVEARDRPIDAIKKTCDDNWICWRKIRDSKRETLASRISLIPILSPLCMKTMANLPRSVGPPVASPIHKKATEEGGSNLSDDRMVRGNGTRKRNTPRKRRRRRGRQRGSGVSPAMFHDLQRVFGKEKPWESCLQAPPKEIN